MDVPSETFLNIVPFRRSSVQFEAVVAAGEAKMVGDGEGVAVGRGVDFPYVPLISISLAKFVSTPKKPNAVSI